MMTWRRLLRLVALIGWCLAVIFLPDRAWAEGETGTPTVAVSTSATSEPSPSSSSSAPSSPAPTAAGSSTSSGWSYSPEAEDYRTAVVVGIATLCFLGSVFVVGTFAGWARG